MKKAIKKILCGIFLLTLVCVVNSYASYIFWFEDITITPSIPTEADTVTVDISCGTDQIRGWGLLYLEHSTPSINLISNLIEIDLLALEDMSVDFGFDLDEMVIINPLPAGDYTLKIDLHANDIYTETTQFTVVPEPTTLLLFGLGCMLLRRKR